MIYAQDDFPQCALYTGIGPGAARSGGQGAQAEGAGADGWRAPLFPFAFSINATQGTNDESEPVVGGGGMHGSKEGEGMEASGGDGWEEDQGSRAKEASALFAVEWRRDGGHGPMRTGKWPHVSGGWREQLSLVPLDYGIRFSDFL